MTFIGDMREAVERLAAFAELDVDLRALPASAQALSDRSVGELLSEVTRVMQSWQTVQSVLSGVVSQRSGRGRGHEGLAAKGGFRTPVEMVRVLAGVTKGEAVRAVKVGESLIAGPGATADEPATGDAPAAAQCLVPWDQPLCDALLAGGLSQAQFDAIRRGLGDPPGLASEGSDALVEDLQPDAATLDAWRAAAGELAREADGSTVEQLRVDARTVRDLLDEDGARDRARAQFEGRSLRLWRDADGVRHASIVFDREMGEWVENLFSSALRPRRGGPRFVAADERTAAEALVADPRSNEQLTYDLFVDVLRAGGLAEAKDVFGTREPGVRLIVIKDAVTGDAVHRDVFGRLVATGVTEDGAATVDAATLERAMCVAGSVDVTLDDCGRPLDLGREARLFTPRQKLMLAVRDGGCVWPGCDRPAAMTEAHHCRPWSEGGRTDIDDGILICRFHHLELHFRGWAIENDGAGRFLLVPPAGAAAGGATAGSDRVDDAPIPLRSKSPLRWFWDPPPDRPRWRSRPVVAA